MKLVGLMLLMTVTAIAVPIKGQPQHAAYLYDFSASGGASGTRTLTALGGSLPVSGVVTGLNIQVVEPITSNGSATLAFGNSSSSTGYLTATAKATLVNNYTKNQSQLASGLLWDHNNKFITPYLMDASTKNNVTMTIGVADLIGGKVYLLFDYYVPGVY